ncbi:MAG: GHKL domain-containing protein, partial [Myxococcales bacterium]|nr:GHKL domain-containing protein [Myxococcales bacterium]
ALDALTASLSEKVNDQAKRLMDANDQLLRAERVSALGLLATNVGHELNNPLAVILASNHWLKERLADTADRDVLDAVDDTIGAADRAATIVRDLKVFAGSQDQPRLVSADVNEVVERTLRLLSLELRRAGHVSWTAKRLPPAGIDPQRLTQILLNVLVNACQSLPESRAGNNDSTIDIEASVQNDMVVIIIDDSGEGLSPDARRHMFEPFFTTKAQGKGTGLGLYVTHGLIQEVAGTIALEDNPAGRGTRVRIGIPVAGSLRNSKSPSMSGRVESARVLVVDSEPGVAKSIGYALTGYDVVALTDPTAALAALLARSQDFDVVVCGLDMPPLSGPELYRAVIAQAPHLKHRFLFLRSAGISPGVAAFAADHVEATLDKRASPHVLRRRVNSVALRPDTP